MTDVWTCDPWTKPFDAVADVPGSKSLTNRALVLAALASGRCRLTNVLFADDTRFMLENLQTLGLSLEVDEAARTVAVDAPGSPDFATEDAELFCGNSGTTIRFLTALLAVIGDATFTLDGVNRMRERPVGPLATLLNGLASDEPVRTRGGNPPITVKANGLDGGTFDYASGQTLSSQFLSAAVMAAPYTRNETRINLRGAQVSWPYVKMTMRLMDEFGVTPEVEVTDDDAREPQAIVVPRGRYSGVDYAVEPDASAASYFLGVAAIHPGSRVTIPGLGTESLQGDAAFADVLQRMNCHVTQTGDATTLTGPDGLTGIDADLSDMPDCSQTLAVVALFAAGETTIRGLRTLRVKETDRVAALENELTKLGADVAVLESRDDLALRITPPARLKKASIATYDDHRMAMSFALAATKRRGIEIEHPGCVSKTYPRFFEDMESVRQD